MNKKKENRLANYPIVVAASVFGPFTSIAVVGIAIFIDCILGYCE